MKNQSRRNFLRNGLFGAGVLALSAGGIWYNQRETLANKLFDDFPNEITGAREVEKHKIIDAEKTLVHVRQVHVIDGVMPLEEVLSDEEHTKEEKRGYAKNIVNRFREISDCQKDIYSILDYLIQNNGLKEVYSEGVSLDTEDKVTSMARELCDLEIERIFSLGYFGDKLDEKTRKLLQLIPGADRNLAARGKIKIKGCETDSLNNLTQMAMNVDRKLYEEGNNLRENTALELISRNKTPLNVLVYGGAHQFGNNIDEWNEQHPDKRYSLIEVTPKSYR